MMQPPADQPQFPLPVVSLASPVSPEVRLPPVAVKITPVFPPTNIPSNSPEDFWNPIRQHSSYKDWSVPALENLLVRRFGNELRARMIAGIDERLKAFEQYRMARTKQAAPQPQAADAQPPLESPEYRALLRARDALVVAQFAVRIGGYGSFDFWLIGLQQVLTAFQNNFDLFEAFVIAFVPDAFADVYTPEFANLMRYHVVIPPEYAVAAAAGAARLQGARPAGDPGAAVQSPTLLQRQVAVLSRLGNSWLLPVVLCVVVLVLALNMLDSYRNSQAEAFNPIIEHQQELLKEDRERFAATRTLEHAIVLDWLQRTSGITLPTTSTVTTTITPTDRATTP